jgi:hypothetical protein
MINVLARTSNLHWVNDVATPSELLTRVSTIVLLGCIARRRGGCTSLCSVRAREGGTMLSAVFEILEFGFLPAMLQGEFMSELVKRGSIPYQLTLQSAAAWVAQVLEQNWWFPYLGFKRQSWGFFERYPR